MAHSKKMIHGMQKDVAQLVDALGSKHPDPELRIQVGRRVAYGLVAKGKFREPTPEDLKQIAAALQQPEMEGIDPDVYGGKVPAIEISRGGELLFRQERDGAVTRNSIQQLLQQVGHQISQSDISATPVQSEATRSEPATEGQSNIGVATEDHMETISTLRGIAEQAIAEARDPQIASDGSKAVTLAEHDGVAIVATQQPDSGLEVTCLDANEPPVSILKVDGNGQVQPAEPEIVRLVTKLLDNQQPTYEQRLTANLQSIAGDAPEQVAEPVANMGQIADRLLQPLGPQHPLNYERVRFGDYTVEKGDGLLTVRRYAEPILQIKDGLVQDLGLSSADLEAFKQLDVVLSDIQPQQPKAAIQEGPLEEPLSSRLVATTDPSRTVDSSESQSMPGEAPIEEEKQSPALSGAAAVAIRQAEKLPEGKAKQFVKALSFFGAQVLDKGLESYQWVRDEALAYKAFNAFQQAYERTGKKSHEVGGLQITLKGTNHYTLSDSEGELMSFNAHSMPGIKQPVIQMANRSPRLSQSHHGAFCEVNRLFAEGGQEVEYNAKKQQALDVVRQILTEAPSGSCENRRYKLETKSDGQLHITDKQDRSRGEKGLIYGYNDKGKFVDRLGVKDFHYFQGYQERKQNAQTHQPSPSVHSVNGTQVQQLSATLSAHKVLDALGTNVYVGNFYHFDRQQGELRITARDGRGDVTGQLNDNDITHINQLAKGIDGDDLTCVDLPEQPSQTRQLVYSTASTEIEPD